MCVMRIPLMMARGDVPTMAACCARILYHVYAVKYLKECQTGLNKQMRNVGLVLWQMMILTQCFCISFFWVGNINQYLVYCSRFSHYTSHVCIFINVLCKNHCSEDARKAANEIIKKKRLSGDKTCVIRLTGEAARPQNEWSENDMLAMAFPVEFPFGLSSFRTRRHVPTEDIT